MRILCSSRKTLLALAFAFFLRGLDACKALAGRKTGAGSLSAGLLVGRGSTDFTTLDGHHHCRPRFVHLSPTGNDSSVRITWQTSKRGCSSIVRYKRTSWLGSSGGGHLSPWCTFFSCSATGEEAVFDAQTDCYSMENATETTVDNNVGWEPRIILYRHTVVLDRLVAGQVEYHYEFESEIAHGERSDLIRRTFRSPPKDSPDAPLEFIVFGDMGAPTAEKCPGSLGTIRALREEATTGEIDVIFHNGDISYADGNPTIWDDFQGAIEPISSIVPYAVTVGNHDYGWLPGTGKKKHHHSQVVDASGLESPYLPPWGNFGGDSKGECGYPLIHRFVMPQSRHSSVASRAPFWYSIRMGPAHFLVLSGEHDVSVGSEQRAWMDSEFDAIDRSSSPWVIVLIHRPLYVVMPHKSNRIVGQHLTEMLEDEFIQQNVSLVVSGHVHSMYRSCPLLKGKCKKHGITYITMGSAGKEISALDDREDQPDWVANAQLLFGFGRFQIVNHTHMTFEYVESESMAGRVIDTVVINNRKER